MSDTTPEIAVMMRNRMMALSGAERFMMGISMCNAARRMVLASFPPGLSELETKRLLFQRYYGSEMELPPFLQKTAP